MEFQNEYWTGIDSPLDSVLINDSLVIVIGRDENELPVLFPVS